MDNERRDTWGGGYEWYRKRYKRAVAALETESGKVMQSKIQARI